MFSVLCDEHGGAVFADSASVLQPSMVHVRACMRVELIDAAVGTSMV